MKIRNKIAGIAVVGAAMGLGTVIYGHSASAALNLIGSDWSKYQGVNGVVASNDEFTLIQVGGSYGGSYVDQSTYVSQVASAKRQGLRAHSYIWFQVGSSTALGNACVDRFLPMVKTPKGSIVALDFEAGASSSVSGNTDAIISAMSKIKAAGYTPMLYSGEYYLKDHVDTARLLSAYPNSLWVAKYPDYSVAATPNFAYFPSMDGVAMWQFTSTHVSGGLDGNVDLTGITYSGYSKTSTPTVVTKPTVTSTTNNKMVQTTMNTTGTVKSGTAKYYYQSNYKLTSAGTTTAGTYKIIKKGVVNNTTYYLIAKNSGTAIAWVPATGVTIGGTSTPATPTTPTVSTGSTMTQSASSGTAQVTSASKCYYLATATKLTTAKVAAGTYNVTKYGVKDGKGYYLLTNSKGSAVAWALASSVTKAGAAASKSGVGTVNYVKGYGIQVYNANGGKVKNANGSLKKLMSGTSWKLFGTHNVVVNGKSVVMYGVGGNQYVPASYIVAK